MKFKNLENDDIIEVKDKERIKKFQGYPDLFVEIKEEKENPKKDDIQLNKSKEKGKNND